MTLATRIFPRPGQSVLTARPSTRVRPLCGHTTGKLEVNHIADYDGARHYRPTPTGDGTSAFLGAKITFREA